jgi:hypothetical protein
MLFSALVNRTIGNKKTTDDRSGMNGLTAREFFGRFSKLQRFLVRHIQEALAQLNLDDQQPRVLPSLYPVLALLARLKPSPCTDVAFPSVEKLHIRPDQSIGINDGVLPTDMSGLLDLVSQCATDAPIFKIRKMAARAFVSLLPEKKDMLAAVDDSIDKIIAIGQKSAFKQNALNGRVLQLSHVLDYHYCSKGSSDEDLEESTAIPGFDIEVKHSEGPGSIDALSDLVPKLSAASWILEPSHHVADVTRSLYLSILRSTVLGLPTESGVRLRKRLQLLVEAEFRSFTQRGPSMVVGAFYAQKQMAITWIFCAMQAANSRSDSVDKLARFFILDSCYEVRMASMDMLSSLMRQGERKCRQLFGLDQWIEETLASIKDQAAETQTQFPPLLVSSVKFLSLLLQDMEGNVSRRIMEKWRLLLTGLVQTPSTSLMMRATALGSLGSCVMSYVWSDTESPGALASRETVLVNWTQLVFGCSSPDEVNDGTKVCVVDRVLDPLVSPSRCSSEKQVCKV